MAYIFEPCSLDAVPRDPSRLTNDSQSDDGQASILENDKPVSISTPLSNKNFDCITSLSSDAASTPTSAASSDVRDRRTHLPLLLGHRNTIENLVNRGREVFEHAQDVVIDSSYLTDENLRAITLHKFVAGEYTYLDQLFYQYWWIPCLRIVPQWLAPNCLTVFGFLLSITSFVLIYLESPTLQEPIGPVPALLASLCIFLYQTLDALDGLHARKYGYGSPLGQLLDHGCDAFTTGFFAHIQVAILRLGVANWSGCMILFFFQSTLFIYTWWEKNFHEYRTNSVNRGVTEGQMLLIVQLCFIAYYGHDIAYEPFKSLPSLILPESIANPLEVTARNLWTNTIIPQIYFLDEMGNFFIADVVIPVIERLGSIKLVRFITLINVWIQGEMVVRDIASSFFRCWTEDKLGALWEYSSYVIHIVTMTTVAYSGVLGVPSAVVYLNGSFSGGILAVRLILSTVGKRRFSIIQWPEVPVLLGCGTIAITNAIFGPSHWLIVTLGPFITYSIFAFQLCVAIHLIVLSTLMLRKYLAVRVFHVSSPSGD